ncbi:uncharacterized protein BDW70DRAFT_23245 [Aspergillus foveolatus]|uniref:uncharacterized protein n=1 Tax=Aspergillus foveolatus TaxID=210207 RepID=UPI003CCD171D
MMAELDRDYDSVATMTLLCAVRWAIQAWEVDLTCEAIQNCFTKALTTQDDTEMIDIQLINELQSGLDQLAVSNIREIMKIDQFLNPIEEQVTDDLEDLDTLILSQFSAEGAEESDVEEILEVLPKISANDALEALYKLRLLKSSKSLEIQHFFRNVYTTSKY